MPDAGRLAAFALVSFAIIVVPGPSVLFVISRGVALGRRAALTTVLGNEAGLLVQVVAVALGLGAIVQRSVAVFTVLKLAGAAYLVYLGMQALRRRRSFSAQLAVEVGHKSARRIFRDGFVVGVSNPKSVILFTAILPQFVTRSNGHVTMQLLVLGAMSVVIALVSDSVWGVLAGGVRSWLGRSPRRLEVMRGTGGVVMMGLGLRLALTGRKD
ncbi:MAG TPA: LysE family translocator [Acidimicrobiales bacterium]|nr:LysE family translocator [Acidimicrobiales bacterium]